MDTPGLGGMHHNRWFPWGLAALGLLFVSPEADPHGYGFLPEILRPYVRLTGTEMCVFPLKTSTHMVSHHIYVVLSSFKL